MISIVIPVFNREDLVGETIDSCLINQGQPALDIVVVDDGSTDGTKRNLSAYGNQIRLIALDANGGQLRARNTGLREARGRYVKFLDSDDVLEPGTLVREVTVAESEHADILLSGFGVVDLDEKNKPIESTRRRFRAPVMEPPIDCLLAGKAVPNSAVLYRRSYIQDLEWDPNVRRPDDWLYLVKAVLRGGRIVTREGTAYWHREHKGTRVNSGSLLSYAYEHGYVLRFIEDHLRRSGQLTTTRRLRLAQYYYKQIHVLAHDDRGAFDGLAAHILELDPDFMPKDEERRRFLRVLARSIGFRRSALLWATARRVRNRLGLIVGKGNG